MNIKTILGIAIAVVIVGGGAYWYSQKTADVITVPSNWITNTDLGALGIEFKYSPVSGIEPKLVGGPTQKTFIQTYTDKSDVQVTAAKQDDTSLDFAKLMNVHIENSPTTYYEYTLNMAQANGGVVSSTTVDGISAVQTKFDCNKQKEFSNRNMGIEVTTARNGIMYIFTAKDICKNPGIVSTFNQLLASVHFR